ncbi:MAG: DUF4136 domain-containing protein [Ignavibacteriaceae bacterium]
MKTINQKRNIILFRIMLFLLFTSFGFLFNSCYPGETLTAADSDVVATFFNPNADFSTKMTYAIPDSIDRIDKDGNPVSDPGQFDAQIISRIKQNLNGLGFTEQQNPANADVLVVAFINKTTWASGGCYQWGYGWWYQYGGYCYPVVYTYSTGTLLIVMADRQSQGSTDALWVAGINGLLEDASSGIETRLATNINQAFNQSPYLGNGK